MGVEPKVPLSRSSFDSVSPLLGPAGGGTNVTIKVHHDPPFINSPSANNCQKQLTVWTLHKSRIEIKFELEIEIGSLK